MCNKHKLNKTSVEVNDINSIYIHGTETKLAQ